MDIQEVIKERDALEEQITRMIIEFEEKYKNVIVKEIHFNCHSVYIEDAQGREFTRIKKAVVLRTEI
jgi:hypothetical protein